jgi:A/G-specific adenine glycosylase
MTALEATDFGRDLSAWGRRHRRSFPWRRTRDSFRVLLAEVLLQRSRGTTVAAVYAQLVDRWPTPSLLADANHDQVRELIRPLGLTNRASTLVALARRVTELGGVPETVEGLVGLPGVGPYAANATAAVAFGIRAPVVDGVTARVYRRYFGLSSERPPSADKELWDVVAQVTPDDQVREWNWAVLDLAATICLPKVPRCPACPLQSHCAWSQARFASS